MSEPNRSEPANDWGGLLAMLLSSAAGLSVSVGLIVREIRPSGCAGADCGPNPGGLVLPILGALFFAALYVGTVAAKKLGAKAKHVQTLAYAGAAISAALVIMRLISKSPCLYCTATALCSFVALLSASSAIRSTSWPPEIRAFVGTLGLLMGLGLHSLPATSTDIARPPSATQLDPRMPQQILDNTGFIIGHSDRKLIFFGDLFCHPCHDKLEELKRQIEAGEDMEVRFLHFPREPLADYAARICQQFPENESRIRFAQACRKLGDRPTREAISREASRLGLTTEQITEAEQNALAVAKQTALGRLLQVSVTPTLFKLEGGTIVPY